MFYSVIKHTPTLRPRIYPCLVRYASTSNRATTSYRHLTISGGIAALIGVGLVGARSLSTQPIRADTDLLQAQSQIPIQRKLGSGKYAQPEPQAGGGDSLGALIRAYVVYTMCSFPTLIDVAPKVLEALMGIPVVRNVTEAVVRVTFFDQFVGGDTAQQTLSLLHKLRAANKGVLFAYSIEVDEAEATASSSQKKGPPVFKRCVEEMITSINVAADFEDSILGSGKGPQTGRRTWVAIKTSALLPNAQSLIALSSHITATRPQHQPPIPFPGCARPTDLSILLDERISESKFLSKQDVADLRELYSDLRRICMRAQERGVRLIFDAEYSWYQPANDAMQMALMREFNRNTSESSKGDKVTVQPLVYGTFQAYLRRTPLQLAESYRDAQANNYAFGVKLVRGAYHTHEIAAHEGLQRHSGSLSISPDVSPPVWVSKNETDKCYDECARMLVGWIKDDVVSSSSSNGGWFGKGKKATSTAQLQPTIGVLFGTHNWSSTKSILNELVKNGLASTASLEDGDGEAVLRLANEVTERVTFGQLFGMSDSLTDYIVRRTISNTPMVIKYVPYGALSETMPYLSRRAIENKSVLGDGHAQEERKRAGKEIWAKLFG